MNPNGHPANLWKPGRRLDPATFDEAVVIELTAGRRPAGRVRTVDWWEAVRRLHARRLTDGQIAYRLGKNIGVVLKIRQRFDLAAVAGQGRRGPLDLPRAGRRKAEA